MELTQIFCQTQNIFIYVEKDAFLYRMFSVRDFIILCNNPEYKRMTKTTAKVSQMMYRLK